MEKFIHTDKGFKLNPAYLNGNKSEVMSGFLTAAVELTIHVSDINGDDELNQESLVDVLIKSINNREDLCVHEIVPLKYVPDQGTESNEEEDDFDKDDYDTEDYEEDDFDKDDYDTEDYEEDTDLTLGARIVRSRLK